MPRDIPLNKTETILRCIQRITEEYEGKSENLHHFTKQDSIILNLQRACKACIDLAMHIVSERRLGLPQNSRDAFDLLHKEQILGDDLTRRMKAMVGFRHIAVHDYQAVQIPIIQSILEHHLGDFQEFVQCVTQ